MLLLTGCSQSYNGERLFWKAQHAHESLLKDPSKAASAEFALAIKDYEFVMARAPGTTWAGRAQFTIASLHAAQQQYADARSAYALVLQNYNRERELCLKARVAIAKTYEAEKNWDAAVLVYRDITEYHPWTKMGLEAPLYIAVTYEKRKQTEQATAAYERAVRLYAKMIPDAPTPELGWQVKGYLALAYQRLGAWEKAIKLLEELVQVSKGINRPLVLLTLGSIYETKLGNVAKATEAYTKLVKEFPEHPFGKAAKTQLAHLGQSATSNPAAPATPSTMPQGTAPASTVPAHTP